MYILNILYDIGDIKSIGYSELKWQNTGKIEHKTVKPTAFLQWAENIYFNLTVIIS